MTMTNGGRWLTAVLAALSLSACATVPMPAGPSVVVLPTEGKPLDLFQAEDYSCRRWAEQQIGIGPLYAADEYAADAAVAGTVVGATIGAIIGAPSGHAGEGAILGGGYGLLLGASSAAEAGAGYDWEVQREYDIAYQQCMYAYGNVIPGMTRRVWRSPPPPPGGGYPPPSGRRRYLPPPPPPPPR